MAEKSKLDLSGSLYTSVEEEKYTINYIISKNWSRVWDELLTRCNQTKKTTLLNESITIRLALQQCIDGELPEIKTVQQLITHLGLK